MSEVKNATVAYLGPAGDMLAGVGSLATGAVALGPHLATVARSTGLVTVAQKALNIAMSLNPIGLVLTAVGLAVAAYVTWKDEHQQLPPGRLEQAFVGAIEGAVNFLRPLADFIGIELPDDLGSLEVRPGGSDGRGAVGGPRGSDPRAGHRPRRRGGRRACPGGQVASTR